MRIIEKNMVEIAITDEQDAVLKAKGIDDKDVSTLLGERDVICAPWQGMHLVVEPDGYTHS